MTMLIKTLAAVAAAAVLATSAFAQSAGEVRAASPFLPIENEPAPKLIVDRPLPEPLARGAVLIPYRTENFRIVPVFGAGASNVSPRVGHLHVTVDDLPWRWADTGHTNTVVVVGLPPGQHKVLIELASPEHRVVTGQAVTFTVPDIASDPH
jgi:UDP:flavonoid glycosyltransferase YjiC (YdhE family)